MAKGGTSRPAKPSKKEGGGKRASTKRAASRRRATRTSADAGPDDLDLGSDKLYFKIGEVAEIIAVPAYVLRYWETEFKAVKPQKSRTQQRVYRRRDVATLLRIKHLLYDQKFTIAGARQQLKEAPDRCEPAAPSGLYMARQSLRLVRKLLGEAKAMASADAIDRAAADPAAFVEAAGGAAAMLGRRGDPPPESLVHREQRDPR
jgi:DNA-binding transcriptional MerR regulator